tara:strand:+ start:591 stop:872 length:282 start_codon:yes stop_codon:yes gene_type:complete
MADKTNAEQLSIATHIRETAFATELASLVLNTDESKDSDGNLIPSEYLAVASQWDGEIEFRTNKSGLSISDLNTKWTTHKASCSDGCQDGWFL